MDAIAGYSSGSDSDDAGRSGSTKKPRRAMAPVLLKKGVSAAPVLGSAGALVPDFVPQSLTLVKSNPTAKELYAPMAGPARPYPSRRVDPKTGHHLTGHVQREDVDDFSFDEQYHTFMSYKFAADPSRPGHFIGNQANFMAAGQGGTVYTATAPPPMPPMMPPPAPPTAGAGAGAGAGGGAEAADAGAGGGVVSAVSDDPLNPRKRKRGLRKKHMDSMVLGDDLWAAVAEDDSKKTSIQKGELSEGQKRVREELGLDKEGEEEADADGSSSDDDGPSGKKKGKGKKKGDAGGKKEEESSDEEDAIVTTNNGMRARDDPPRAGKTIKVADATSKFHGKSMLDYQGRSFIEPPRGLRPDDDTTCYIPKKCIHKWVGHNGGVNSIEFFPKFGHLLLSGSVDTKVKLWDVYNRRNCKRTYLGHGAAVRHVTFSEDGLKFLSSSWDRHVKLWDTETGKCINSFTCGKVPYQSKFRPGDNNSFISACSSKEIVQYDIRAGKQEYVYDYHLAAVNTVTFVDDGRRFISTSDDKKILVWEWNTNVPVKWISEPTMHSMPSVTLHPSGKYFAAQSMDNNINVFGIRNNYRQTNKKFSGHNVAGYACQVGFSNDGRFTMSGDGSGRLFFWDWRTSKVYRKLRAHTNGPCFGAIWHPIEASAVATCGWDGLIKLWD